MRLCGSVCLKQPTEKQELACEQDVLDSKMGNLFCCVFLTFFLPLFRNHLKILGVVFVSSVKILLCAVLKYSLKRQLLTTASGNCLKACKLKSFSVYLIFFFFGGWNFKCFFNLL